MQQESQSITDESADSGDDKSFDIEEFMNNPTNVKRNNTMAKSYQIDEGESDIEKALINMDSANMLKHGQSMKLNKIAFKESG